MLVIFFNINRIVHQEFVLAGQTLSSEYYCGILRRQRGNMRRLRQELWLQKNCLLLHDNTPFNNSFFSQENFDQK
jgi:hypothetical protein